jgi:hypothetical protein
MTDTKQPEALRLAEILQHRIPSIKCLELAATELRRLHEVNAELLEALKEICDCPQFVDEATVPKAGIEVAPQQVVINMSVALVRLRKAKAAIAKAEVTK